MIKVNVTRMFATIEPRDCSNSVANLGPNAASYTWAKALPVAKGSARYADCSARYADCSARYADCSARYAAPRWSALYDYACAVLRPHCRH